MPRYDQQGSSFEHEKKEVLMEVATFTCSICGEASRHICTFCTKDACRNHLCERCHRCSDCCECDMPVTGTKEEEAPEETREPAGAAAEEAAELATPLF